MSSDAATNRACGGRRRAAPWGPAWATCAALAWLAGCSSGTGGSDVGEAAGAAPTARVQVLNGGEAAAFREGSEVLITGKASEDADGPVLYWRWAQVAGPDVELLEVNGTTVTFTAPDVAESTELSFELTVEDSSGETGQATADVTVLPARDADKFLSLDVASNESFDTFEVIPAVAGTGAAPAPFTLSARAYLVYPPRSAPQADCRIDGADFAAGIPDSTASGCLVELLEDLTPAPSSGGGTGLESQWPAGVDAGVPAGATDEQTETALREAWWNPRIALRIPRLDVREFNQRFVDGGARDAMLDRALAHGSRIALRFELTAPGNQDDAVLLVPALPQEAAASQAQAPSPAPSKAAGTAMKLVRNAQAGLPTTALIPQESLLAATAGRESALTAQVYYDTVDPQDTRTTLNAWLEQVGFASDANGTLRPEAAAGTGEFAHAIYLNNYDLGFGRDMRTRVDELGNVYAYVVNYGTLEGAIRGTDPIVTVVMEYSPLDGPAGAGDRFVKFFTYADDGTGDSPRITSMDFDGRGERFTPGNCIGCHGGVSPPGVAELDFDDACGDRRDAMCYAWPELNRDGENIADGDLRATFLPWDLDSLLYADTDPAIAGAPVPFDGVTLAEELMRDFGDFSRGAQQAQLKALNAAAYATYCAGPDCPSDAARRLVEHWYGGPDLPDATFDDAGAPPGWRNGEVVPTPSAADPGATGTNPDDAEAVYHDVYARHCRMCHTNVTEPSLRFTDYQTFIQQRQPIRTAVFAQGRMPGARLAMDRLWAPFAGGDAPGDLLAAHLAAIDGGAPAARPGPASAVVDGFDTAPARGTTIRLDGSGSTFASTYQWSLARPGASAAVLAGAPTPHPSFVVDVPGQYTVSLSINEGTGNEATAEVSHSVPNAAPVASDDAYELDLVTATVLEGSVLEGSGEDADPDGDPLTVSLAEPAQHGELALGADGSFVYTFTGDPDAPPSGSDAFGYTVSDPFGGTDRGGAVIVLQSVPDAEPPSAPGALTAADDSAEDGSEARVVLNWTASTDNAQVVAYRIYRTPGFDGGAQTSVSYVPENPANPSYADNAVDWDTSYQYTVTALDGTNESAASNAADVTVDISYSRNLHQSWPIAGTKPPQTGSVWRAAGCTGCHSAGDAASGDLSLRGQANDVLDELDDDPDGDAVARIVPPPDAGTSLILCKPTNECGHLVGPIDTFDASMYDAVERWLEQGAQRN